MPELRKDPVLGRWVIIATERARRPGNFIDLQKNIFDSNEAEQGSAPNKDCPFCHNQDPRIYVVKDKKSGKRQDSWKVLVVPSGTPVLKTNGKFSQKEHGLYAEINGYGTNEVVIETPDHIANTADLDVKQIRLVLETYAARFNALKKDTHLRYVLVYKNYGYSAGGRRIGHSRSQIIASSVTPLSVEEKLTGAKQYFHSHERCLYCDLIRQEREARKRVISESEHFIAITPFAPRFPFEILILPKQHHCDFAQGILGQEDDLARMLKETLLRIKVGIEDPAYNYIIQTAPFRRAEDDYEWQTVEEDYHWHIEIRPRITRVAGFEKGTGFYICAIPPEDTAEFLREVEI